MRTGRHSATHSPGSATPSVRTVRRPSESHPLCLVELKGLEPLPLLANSPELSEIVAHPALRHHQAVETTGLVSRMEGSR
jgi:hypothetical protein